MSSSSNKLSQRGNTTFVMNYASWLEEHKRLISDIQSGLNDHNNLIPDDKLLLLRNRIMKHYSVLLEMKTSAASVDVLKAERNLWRTGGGFRPSELLQVILSRLQHSWTQQQLTDISNLGNSCEQAEEAFSQGLEKLHQILDKATEVDNGFDQQLCFLQQADIVRREFLHQISRILTISQQAEFLIALGEDLHKHNPLRRSSL